MTGKTEDTSLGDVLTKREHAKLDSIAKHQEEEKMTTNCVECGLPRAPKTNQGEEPAFVHICRNLGCRVNESVATLLEGWFS